jgi:hypothetical protein
VFAEQPAFLHGTTRLITRFGTGEKTAMIRCIMERGRLGGMNFKGVNELVYEKL